MMPAAVVRGVVGRIKWSYYVAAAINGYVVTRVKETNVWSLRAQIVMHDRYKLAQKPLFFEAMHERGCWRWPIVDMDIAEGVMTARLGTLQEMESVQLR